MDEDDVYVPLNFAFHSNGIQVEDLESIAILNKITMNIRYMNKVKGDKKLYKKQIDSAFTVSIY